MIYIDELEQLKLYSKPFLLPANSKDKKKGKSVMLLTPNIESSIGLMKHNLLINRYYNSYYIEKDVSFYVNDDNVLEQYDYSNSNYVHESVEGEEQFPLNEGVYNYIKPRIIFDGYSDDVDMAKKYITVEKVEYYSQLFMTKIKYPISVSVYRGSNDLPKPTENTISLFGYKVWNNDADYELYCNEAIIEMIIKNINPKCYSGIVNAVSSVYAGTYEVYKDDITNSEYLVWCNTIKNLSEQPDGMSKIVSIIRKNDVAKLFTKAIKINMDDSNIKELLTEDTMDPIAKLKRHIHYASRKGSAHILNKVANNIEKTVDPNEETPTFDGGIDHTPTEESCSLMSYLNDEYEVTESYIRIKNNITYFDEAGESAQLKSYYISKDFVIIKK
jgi:hypothetical protein